MSATAHYPSSEAGYEKPPSLHDSARGSPEPHAIALDGFESLVADINDILGPSNGIDSAGIDVEELQRAMAAYASDEAEWERYAFSDKSRAYTRNLVDNCNGKSNLLILVWTPGQSSPIHDHANAHCVMKILKGRLTETVYAWPCQHEDNPASCATAPDSPYPTTEHSCSTRSDGDGDLMEPKKLRVRRETTYTQDQVTYMSDRLGLHRVGNPCQGEDEFAVSLHLYTPPNAAKHGCHIFDEKTGKKSHAKQCHFYSEFGHIV